ncbi:MAG: HAD-IIIC family phosphatase [Pyramidobacter sp.]
MITLLSNVTVNSLALTFQKLAGEEAHVPAGYDQWAQQLISGECTADNPAAVFLILHGPELLRGFSLTSDWERLSSQLDQWLGMIAAFHGAHRDTALFVSTLDLPAVQPAPLTAARLEGRAAQKWREGLEKAGVPVLDLAGLAADAGRQSFYSAKMWYLGSMPFSMTGEKLLAREMQRCLNALRGKKKKCLVLDLDNTLWGGVIGEDGMEGIELGPVKEGARYQDFQRGIALLQKQGVLLAVVSKNNPEDALQAIREHPGMVLREKDFVSIRANWLPKPKNIADLASDLNIGLDSMVFLDDNPVERETVKMVLPQVSVPDFPQDTAELPRFIVQVWRDYFLSLRLTKEDLAKTEQYRVEGERLKTRQNYATMDEYLKSLEMKLTFRAVGPGDVARAAQMTQKTNQFNLTTKRFTEGDISRMMDDPARRMWIGELNDRFGSYGKIILAMAEIRGDRAVIDEFLMSCRVMGRGVESAFLSCIESDLMQAGVTSAEGLYIPSAKNSPARNFWASQGYAADGEGSFTAALPAARPAPPIQILR